MSGNYFLPVVAAICLGSAILFAGCDQAAESARQIVVATPPDIPEVGLTVLSNAPEESAEVAVSEGETVDESADAKVGYADVAGLDERDLKNSRLKLAVAAAIHKGILTPVGREDRFEPDAPVTQADFIAWLQRYRGQDPATGPQPRQGQVLAKSPGASWLEALYQPEKAGKQKPLWFQPNDYLTREALCLLYAEIRQPEAFTAASADGAEEELLADVLDLQTISPKARPAVARAYRDNILESVFGLTPEMLTEETGFQPKRPVTRANAILLLTALYGAEQTAEMTPDMPDFAAMSAEKPRTAVLHLPPP